MTDERLAYLEREGLTQFYGKELLQALKAEREIVDAVKLLPTDYTYSRPCSVDGMPLIVECVHKSSLLTAIEQGE